jgi:hypothetical protein
MFDLYDLALSAEMVIGPNERDILNAASKYIDDPTDTSVAMIRLAKEDVASLQYRDVPLSMSGSDFYRHKTNLMSEMDEAISAAYH